MKTATQKKVKMFNMSQQWTVEIPSSRLQYVNRMLPVNNSSIMYQLQRKCVDLDRLLQKTNVELAKLTERTGMPITQENGQRRYGPPIGETFFPSRGSEVFVGKLPRDCIEPEIVPVFEKVGRIYEIRLMMDFSGTNRGYCFIQYFTPTEASRAVNELNHFEIRPGRAIGVTKSVDNCRLFVGGIPKEKSKEQIQEEIRRVTDGVVRVIAYPSVKDKSENRGFAFVEYESHKAAAMARRKMIPGKIQLWGSDVAVDWAEPEPDVDIEIMKKVKALYVRNLLMSTSEDTLRKIFDEPTPGAVERVRKLKDYAFIHFLDRESAENAKERFDQTEIEGSRIEIMWAKPVDKKAYHQQKALARSLYAPTSPTKGAWENKGIQQIGFNNNYFYPGNCQMIQNKFQDYMMGGEMSFHNGGGGMLGAQPFDDNSSRGFEFSGFPSFQSFGENPGLQQSPQSLMPTPAPQQHAHNFDPTILDFQRMSIGNDCRPYRARAAGGVQGMRFPNFKQTFLYG